MKSKPTVDIEDAYRLGSDKNKSNPTVRKSIRRLILKV